MNLLQSITVLTGTVIVPKGTVLFQIDQVIEVAYVS